MEVDLVTIKVHFSYHGEPRCSPFTAAIKDLVNLGLCGFIALIKQNIQFIRRYDCVRLSYFDEDKIWVDLTEENFMDFLKTTSCSGGTDRPKLNVKVFDGCSPATPASKRARIETDGHSRRKLEVEFVSGPVFSYKSPVSIDIALKEEELGLKKEELKSIELAYDEKCELYNLNIVKDKSKKRCTKCHLRTNHTQRNCDVGQCDDVRQCGEIDFHPDEKTALNELIRKKQLLEKDIKTMEVELKIKREAQTATAKTFERQIRDFVINSNPEKYLVNGTGPAVINIRLQADIAILKKHYDNKIPKDLAAESRYFQTIIAQRCAHGATKLQKPKNPVEKRLESNTIFPVRFPQATATVASQMETSSDFSGQHIPVMPQFNSPNMGPFAPQMPYFPIQFLPQQVPLLQFAGPTSPCPTTSDQGQMQPGHPLPGAPPLPPAYEDVPTSTC